MAISKNDFVVVMTTVDLWKPRARQRRTGLLRGQPGSDVLWKPWKTAGGRPRGMAAARMPRFLAEGILSFPTRFPHAIHKLHAEFGVVRTAACRERPGREV
jgi:hypothetical protein